MSLNCKFCGKGTYGGHSAFCPNHPVNAPAPASTGLSLIEYRASADDVWHSASLSELESLVKDGFQVRAAPVAARSAAQSTAPVSTEQAGDAWISVEVERKPPGRTPILVAVSFVRFGEYEDGTPGEFPGQIVAEGEYVPQHGEAGGYFTCYSSPHGDLEGITHWMPLPVAPSPNNSPVGANKEPK